ncbi:MAG: methyl-accepting chemotaxis protein [Bacteriovoracaceae bacterium]
MNRFSLKVKLIFSFLLASLIPMMVIGFYSYNQGAKALENEAIEKLEAVKSLKKEAILRYFTLLGDQVTTLSHDLMIVDAMEGLTEGFKNFSSDLNVTATDKTAHMTNVKDYYLNQFGVKYKNDNGKEIDAVNFLNQLSPNEVALQNYYIATNPNPLGKKETLDASNDNSRYSKLHAKFHPTIRGILQKFGYYDIFLVDINSGNVVYTVFKELDFTTNLLTGPYKDTNLAEAYKKAVNLTDKESFVLVDYKKYAPSYDAPAAFIAAPIWKDDKKIGILIFQTPIDRLNIIMNERSGMGEHGETYLVGEDRLMRSDSFLDNKNFSVVSSFKSPETGTINSFSVEQALSGKSGDHISKNYLGHDVISAYMPIDISGLKWALVAELSKGEALNSIEVMKKSILLTIGISCLLIFIFSLLLSNSLSKKIQSIALKLISSSKEVAGSSDSISSSSSQLSEAATEAASSLQETVSSIDEISSMVQRNADSASNSTQISAKSSDAASRGKKTVESMVKSIGEISDSNEEIATEMKKNNEDISKIVQVISEIGEKTKVINDIVFQTKLLSFNASVEAARAGEHGKGFAVVAEEVGNLAAMSGKAALEITEMLGSSIKQVTDIVESTKRKVEILVTTSKQKVEIGTKTAHECGEALDEILQNVTSVNEMVREIASASAEQSTGVQEVTKAMQQLDQTTHQNTSVAQETSAMARKLKNQADNLNGSVNELIAVISGSGKVNLPNINHTITQKPVENHKHDNKVIKLPKKKSSETIAHKPGIKVSGLDTEIPSESDSRFEDL